MIRFTFVTPSFSGLRTYVFVYGCVYVCVHAHISAPALGGPTMIRIIRK